MANQAFKGMWWRPPSGRALVLALKRGKQIIEAAVAFRFGICVSEIANMFYPNLTQAEGIKLCA